MAEHILEKQNSDIENEKSENIYEEIKKLYYESRLEKEKEWIIQDIERQKQKQKKTNRLFLHPYSCTIHKSEKRRLRKALREDGYKCFGIFGKYLCICSYYLQEKKENKKFTDEELEQLYDWVVELFKDAAECGEQEIYLKKEDLETLSNKRAKQQLRQLFKKSGLNVYIKEKDDIFIIGW